MLSGGSGRRRDFLAGIGAGTARTPGAARRLVGLLALVHVHGADRRRQDVGGEPLVIALVAGVVLGVALAFVGIAAARAAPAILAIASAFVAATFVPAGLVAARLVA